MLTRSSRVVRFGVFAFDVETGDLWNAGHCTRLQDQPRQVLSLLLARPGELVTREALRAALWPDDTFVDFDAGLNVVVNRLRHALRDSASSPRFIETIPRRGYRFIAPVASAPANDDVGEALAEVGSEHPPPRRDVHGPKAPTRRRVRASEGRNVNVPGVGRWARCRVPAELGCWSGWRHWQSSDLNRDLPVAYGRFRAASV